MIEIKIKIIGNKVIDQLKTENTDLTENSIAIRRLEEIKAILLKKEYKIDFLWEEEE